MPRPKATNQQLRTRKDLLQAAARLLKAGREPTFEAVAKEALVSRATVYRYFSDIEALLAEVEIDGSVPDSKELFNDGSPSNIVERVDFAESVMHDFVYKNERQLRSLLSRSLAKSNGARTASDIPARQNRRTDYINEALAPYRKEFDNKTYKKLTEALALVFGPEAMIVFRDVVALEAQRAREVKRWMLTTLVSTALKESRRGK